MSRPAAPKYQAAQEELELYFAAADGIWGRRGAQPEPGGGTVQVWDDIRSNREHSRRVVGALFSDHDKLRAITHSAEQFREGQPDAWETALVVLTPRRWPALLAAEMARANWGGKGNLAGLLLTSERLRVAATRARAILEGEEDDEPLSPAMLLAFAAEKAAQSNVDPSSKRRFFDPLRAECELRFSGALAAYDVYRMARERERRNVEGFRRALG